ncbi:MAG: glycosyl hydrolase family 28-related protein [Bacteroidota bacterium]
MKSTIIALSILFSALSAFSLDVNILERFNGDFEDGINFWRFFEVPSNIGSSWEITSDAINGIKAMKISYVASDGTVTDRGFDNWSAGVPVIAGTEYTLKAAMKSDEASGLKVNFLVGFFDAGGGVIAPQSSLDCALTSTYTEHELIVTAPANASTCWVAFRMYNTTNQRVAGTMYLDNVRMMGPSTELAPRVMTTTLPSDDVPIASIDVTEAPYLAINDGSADATAAFQSAIDRASSAGGAVVFVPAGSYRFNGHLNIPERVVLRGEWGDPDSTAGVTGTILMPYADKDSENGTPFISVQRGAGIKNLSIWYPEQSAASVSPYPWTIHCHPDGSAGSGDNTSVINVTLVNSYKGIKIGPEWNELHYIHNVYGTPLKEGIWLSQTTDIGRIFNVHFEPKYWSGSGLSGAPSEDAILGWMKENATTGITMGRSDWEYIHDVSLVGYKTGVKIIKYTDMGPNGVINGLYIDKSMIGIDLLDINGIGWAISNASIKVEGEGSACIRTGNAFKSVVQFNTCILGGAPETAVLFNPNSTGRLSFQNCTFESWGVGGDGAAIECSSGSLSLLGNRFEQDQLHVHLGYGVTNAQILDNTFPVQPNIHNQSKGKVLISQEPLGFKKMDVPPHPYSAVPRPASDELFDVVEYGAVADGVTDNTAAIQSALDAAGANGGGTVYIPAGMYRIGSHLVVPSGVELRGIWDVPHHTISRGSVLLAYEGKGNPDAAPFISLETGSGARGFTVWYPEQSTDHFYAYPWSIQTLGENCWVKDVTLGNTHQGVDLASYPSAGHVVTYLAGAPLKTGISVGNNSGDGWIESVQFNPHYWGRSAGYPQGGTIDFTAIITHQQNNLEAFKIADAAAEHILGTFVFAAQKGIHLAPDQGNSNIDLFLHGTDAGDNAVYMESKAGSKINFVNTQLVLLGSSQNGIITTGPGFEADAAFYNTVSWGGAGPTTNLNGNGSVLIQQLHTHNGTLKINSGTARMENIAISSSPNPQYILGAGTNGFKLFGSYQQLGTIIYDFTEEPGTAEIDYTHKMYLTKATFSTGWESNEEQNSWDHTLYGDKEFIINGLPGYQCEAVHTGDAHTGTHALKTVGSKIEGSTPLYKIFDSRITVCYNSTLSYWINPQDEAGRTGHLDLLFTDGTRLSELEIVAGDGNPLNAARGTIGTWTEVTCPIGMVAHGKRIKSVLVGAELDTEEQYGFLTDDFQLDGVLSVEQSLSETTGPVHLYPNHPNPFNQQTTIAYNLGESGVVSLTVYDMLGRKISTLTDGQHQDGGRHEVRWTPENQEGGIYLCRLEFLSDNGKRATLHRKMTLSK